MYEKIEFADVKAGDRVRLTLASGDVFEGKVTRKSANYIDTTHSAFYLEDTRSIERERKPLEPGVYEARDSGGYCYLAVFEDGTMKFTAAGGGWVTTDEKEAQEFDWEKG